MAIDHEVFDTFEQTARRICLTGFPEASLVASPVDFLGEVYTIFDVDVFRMYLSKEENVSLEVTPQLQRSNETNRGPRPILISRISVSQQRRKMPIRHAIPNGGDIWILLKHNLARRPACCAQGGDGS